MIGKRSPQRGFFDSDHLYGEFVGRNTFYGLLASQGDELFLDADFAELYCPDNGRPSVAPSLLAMALVLQAHDDVSDEEAKARADYDLRWKVALGVELDRRPFAKSALQLFRAQLVLKDKMRLVFQRGLAHARRVGHFKTGKMRLALDTTYILGRGAVKDTYNLLADGIGQVIKASAEVERMTAEQWAEAHALQRYLAASIKGEAAINWDDEAARQAFLQGIVADVDRVLALSQAVLAALPANDDRRVRVQAAAQLLRQLIDQDVDRRQAAVSLKQEVARDRVVSVHDPAMRHGRKSHSKRFDGHKAAVAVDTDSQLITAVEVLPGNASDDTHALELVEASEQNTGLAVDETLGDCAYGSGATRQAFVEAGRTLIAPVASHRRPDQLSKEEFQLDLDQGTCTCPAQHVTRKVITLGYQSDRAGQRVPRHAFAFDPALCAACPSRPQCVRAKGPGGRVVRLHPQERLLQEARALQNSEAFKPYRRARQAAEHRLARLVQLGIRQARYFGHPKTLFQLLLAATVANLTLIASKAEGKKPQKQRGLFFCPVILAVKSHLWPHFGTFTNQLAARHLLVAENSGF